MYFINGSKSGIKCRRCSLLGNSGPLAQMWGEGGEHIRGKRTAAAVGESRPWKNGRFLANFFMHEQVTIIIWKCAVVAQTLQHCCKHYLGFIYFVKGLTAIYYTVVNFFYKSLVDIKKLTDVIQWLLIQNCIFDNIIQVANLYPKLLFVSRKQKIRKRNKTKQILV